MNDLKGIIEDCNKSDLVSDKIIKKIIEIIGQEEWQILHDENIDICTTMGELIITLKGVAGLEAEIKKMKCCQNCLHYRHFTSDISECAMSFVTSQDCRRKDFYKWESKEKKLKH